MGLDEASMMNRLRKTECPVFWKLDIEENTKVSMCEKLAVKNEEIAGQVWRHIVLELAMCCEWHKTAAAYPIMSQKLQECLSTVNNAQESSFIKKYEAAFLHLILTTKTYVAIMMARLSEAARAINQIVNLNEMSDPERAAVYGIKANVYAEYGIGGTREAFVWVREAIKLDSSEPEWHFLLGKLHARQRHYVLLREPSAEEIASLEKAYEGLKKPHTAVYLADCCAERAKFLFFKQPLVYGKREISKEDDLTVKELNRKAMKLYDEARELNGNQCLHIMIRCAHGFAILPGEFRDTKKAQELAEKAASPEGGTPDNPMLSATLSMIYKNYGELNAAIAHAKKSALAGAFGSHIRLMNLYHAAKREFDVDACIDRALAEFPYDVYKLQLYVYGSIFFLFAKRNLFKSLPYFEKAVELDPKFNLLQDRYVRWVKVYLNMYELMYNEIECAIKKESYVTDKERELLIRVREKIRAAWPAVVNMTIQKDLLGKLRENRFPSSRGRPRTRSNKKGVPKGKGKRNMNSKKRLKSALSTTAHSKDSPNQQIRSASDDRVFSSKRHLGQKPAQFGAKPHCKRALSHDGRSQSREDGRRKILKEMMENVRKSITDLTISEGDLKPQMPGNQWGAGGAKQGSSNLEVSMSQLSLDSESGRKDAQQRKKPDHFPKRSVSFDRQLLPQKKTTAEAANRKLDDKFCFMPDFKKPAGSVQYGSLTVENVERLRSTKVAGSQESLDSDDTQDSHMSSVSVQRESNETRSVSSVSLTTKRSVSLDDSRSLPSGPKSGESASWFNICENDPYCSAFEIDSTPVRQTPNAKLVCADRRQVSRSPRTSGGHGQSLSDRMRELSLEKKPDSYSNTLQHRPGYRQTGGPGLGRPQFQDRKSPFGRSNTERVLMPPGVRRQRSDSETSASSVDSDYVGSRWSNARACAKYKPKP